MINAYPITAIQSYQTHKDYYRVSAVRSVAGSRTSTSRQPLDLPYDRSAYKRLAQRTAQELAGLVQSAQNVKQSVRAMAESRLPLTQPETKTITKPIQAFVDAYNAFQDQLRDSPDYLKRSILNGQVQAAQPHALEGSGISELADGRLEVQMDELKKQVTQRNDLANKSLGSIANFAESLSGQLERLEQLPTEALFQMNRSPLKPYGQYRSKLQAYLPVPMSGLLLDRRM
ncbi:hypothetical protein ACFQZT_18440 [Paenibacillus sp. GCM10027628]|uniref:hypothetical protein n=1 Tax=Paenibacillus sp. GCM10027628 TaxID=3273413 RepID=UPI003644AA11